ncbi:MAG: hypothetical protein ABIQ66_05260 [Novosphingobium sp.]
MAKKQSRIGWKTSVVMAICVADAAGIYAVHVKLNAPSAASQRADAVAYGAPTQQFTFHPDASLAVAAPITTPRSVRVDLPAPVVAQQAELVSAVPVRLAKLVMPEVQLTARAALTNQPVEAQKSAPRVAHFDRATRHDRAFNAAFADGTAIGVIPDLTFDQQVEIAEGKADLAQDTPAMASLAPADRQAVVGQDSGELPAIANDPQADGAAPSQTAN